MHRLNIWTSLTMEVTGRELKILKEKKQLSMEGFFGLVKKGED